MQHPLEIILTRQWASIIDYPIWLMDLEGNLIYYNEPAEKMLGLRYEISGIVFANELQKFFKTADIDGKAISADSLPINIALKGQNPEHKKFKVNSLDGTLKWIESTAFPLLGQGGKCIGAMSIFWEVKEP